MAGIARAYLQEGKREALVETWVNIFFSLFKGGQQCPFPMPPNCLFYTQTVNLKYREAWEIYGRKENINLFLLSQYSYIF